MNIEHVRRAYAQKVCAASGAESQSLVEAFARVPRERFLGPAPWTVFHVSAGRERNERPGKSHLRSLDEELQRIYDDVLVALVPERKLNNGQPSAHALWIGATSPRPGDRVLHIGCATGYYTAIFAELVGSAGSVVAVEVEPDLALRARDCLSPWPQVEVRHGDASTALGEYDIVYVNAGATHARPAWLSALAEGGRLLLPLTVHWSFFGSSHGSGIVLQARREGSRWPARVVSPVGIYDCAGARSDEAEAQLRALLKAQAAPSIRTLSIDPHERAPSCALHLDRFCLQR